ncbi:flippase-like domain-containing protein [Flavihumibacter rivuli]|uniref:lysylphosphatidylglycerol synthase transmembrane domain-containing protein n=1 Tax=Flavihumibacter rivuli TaxID=2838156 RepID=UPI001BDF5D89|nr:lysylphosphatidylglycerol synthase transmembrane domain-containing protein [Flavihumibacter rivuli]ULQ56240.1 flippase-like domain-containing protein [Flavihumibacter rivuli]
MPVAPNNDAPSSKSEVLHKRYWLWSFLLFVAVFAFVLYYFAEIKKEFVLLEKINPGWLFLALVGQLLTYCFTALIYLVLLRCYKEQQLPGLWQLVKASIVSLFFNQTVPSAGISGNAYFFRFLSGYKMSTQHIMSLIITELVIFYAAMELLLLLLLAGSLYLSGTPHVFKVVLIAGMLIYLLFGVAIGFAGRNNWIGRLFKRFASKHRLADQLSTSELQLGAFLRQHQRSVLKALLIQLLVVAADGFTLYALFVGLGISLSVFHIVICLVATKIVSVLPFLPGGLILYESSMTYFFVTLGVPLASAVIITLVYRLLSFWIPIPLGFVFNKRWHKVAAG